MGTEIVPATKTQDVGFSREEMEKNIADFWAYIATGKITSLEPAARSKLYVDFCVSLGLDPRMRPIGIVEGGLYISKAACEWYASKHHITRHASKPVIITEEGQKMIYICATANDGKRDEEDHYYRTFVPKDDLATQYRKAVSAAKRRATLPFISSKAPTSGLWLEDDVEELGMDKQDFVEGTVVEAKEDATSSTDTARQIFDAMPESEKHGSNPQPAQATQAAPRSQPARQQPAAAKSQTQQSSKAATPTGTMTEPEAHQKCLEACVKMGVDPANFEACLNHESWERYRGKEGVLLSVLRTYGEPLRELLSWDFWMKNGEATQRLTADEYSNAFTATLDALNAPTGATPQGVNRFWFEHRADFDTELRRQIDAINAAHDAVEAVPA